MAAYEKEKDCVFDYVITLSSEIVAFVTEKSFS